ncbi:sulfotransferase [Croceicoccus estronivorus]|nr:sulfotransferase [Croceicoccus estronivorus]
MPHPELDPDRIAEKTSIETGLDHFGDPWFHRPLDKLAHALREEAHLNPLGQFVAEGQIRKVLRDRLWAQQWFSRHPEILERPLPHPVIVVGAMRSGTTRLHRLLAADNRFAHLRFFETVSPVPKPDVPASNSDRRRIAMARHLLRAVRIASPRTQAIHPTGPMQPEEELGLLVSSAWGMKHEAQWSIPGYGRWSEQEDPRPAYEYMARLLKLVSWVRGDSSLKPWILKTPQHMLDLDALMQVFPDARLIFIHRDPVRVVGSACSLVWNQTNIHTDHADPHRIGREWLRKTSLQVKRMQDARMSIPERQMIDVHYADMDHDWRHVMGRIYRFLNMDIKPALPAMRRYLETASAEVAGPHRYTLESFGIEREDVIDELSDYIQAFEIPMPHQRTAQIYAASTKQAAAIPA